MSKGYSIESVLKTLSKFSGSAEFSAARPAVGIFLEIGLSHFRKLQIKLYIRDTVPATGPSLRIP
jgi:hypothetical protein